MTGRRRYDRNALILSAAVRSSRDFLIALPSKARYKSRSLSASFAFLECNMRALATHRNSTIQASNSRKMDTENVTCSVKQIAVKIIALWVMSRQ